DSHSWQPASALTHLFPPPPALPPVRAAGAAAGPGSEPETFMIQGDAAAAAAAARPQETPTPSASPTELVDVREEAWYYDGGDGQPTGPVSLNALKGMLRDGGVQNTTLVSRPG